MGQAFSFNHPKGIAEWIKNSIDAYKRSDFSDDDTSVILLFEDDLDGEEAVGCLDFVGMDDTDIESAFKKWFSALAATRGKDVKTFGGHGNGGKFYMRQMFEHAHFVTYKDGKISVFGFNEDRRYGYDEGYQGRKLSLDAALKLGNIQKQNIPKTARQLLEKGKTGFTIVWGYSPKREDSAKRKKSQAPEQIIEKLRHHPQLMRVLNRITLSVFKNGESLYGKLVPEKLQPYSGFETPKIVTVPDKLPLANTDGEGEVVIGSAKYSAGRLVLHTSEIALDGSKYGELNRLDVIGEVGGIASYPFGRLEIKNFPQANHIWGELENCEILESAEHDSVQNDRVELVNNERTRALLSWIAQEVDKLAKEIAEKDRKDNAENDRKISSEFNKFLNDWKDKVMRKLIEETIGGSEGGDKSGNKGTKKKTLEEPESALEFLVSEIDIPLKVKYPLILKTRSPEEIPVGAVIALKSSGADVTMDSDTIVVSSDDLKIAASGAQVGVLKAFVTGEKLDATSEITAEVGGHEARIVVRVVKDDSSGKSKGPKPQQVLLSNHDVDPLGIVNGPVELTPRHTVVFQRREDLAHGIYWINTANPMARYILDKYGAKSLQFRTFLFNRYLEIFQKDLIFELERKEPENFNAARVDEAVNNMLIGVLSAASKDLSAFLTDDAFSLES
ncbi:MAG: hypothetical protein QY323_02725 [Patescibacteria group bacterium]|nr:MAG: hypothetical protein QY323_02725 [Patescibacteria group bacterium]